MRTKNIKKLVAFCLTMSVSLWMFGGSFVVANNTADTSLVRDTSGGATPIVKAKWEMNGPSWSGTAFIGTGTDDTTAVGAQFLPSGQYQVNKDISLCAVVTDPDGLADIDAVYADVFYPDVALGDSHIPLNDQSGLGCEELMQEDTLKRLSMDDGIELFCNKVRNNNNNLPTFNTNYNYDEICNPETGELVKMTAAVYCGDKTISYEDPSGEYKVLAVAQDKNGLQGTLENHFNYLPVVAFDKDFTAVNYGNVKLNTHKIISGDIDFSTSDKPTVRNVGNTRISIKVMQDDMGLGMTDGIYNVRYDGRVGSDAGFVNYVPYQTRILPLALDLSEMNEMDFSIDISKFPPIDPGPGYTGTMTLSAQSAPHLPCEM